MQLSENDINSWRIQECENVSQTNFSIGQVGNVFDIRKRRESEVQIENCRFMASDD